MCWSFCCPWAAINQRGPQRGNSLAVSLWSNQVSGWRVLHVSCMQQAAMQHLGGGSESGKPWGFLVVCMCVVYCLLGLGWGGVCVLCVCARMGGAEEGTGGGVGGLAAATVDHATMWDIANEEARREGRKAAAGGVERYALAIGWWDPRHLRWTPQGSSSRHCRTDQIINAARSPGQASAGPEVTAGVCVRVRPVAFLLVDLVVGPRQV